MSLSNIRNPLHLPAEILYRIVDFIPIDHVLLFRSVCRSFQHHIDTHVMYSYLLRTRLVGYALPKGGITHVLNEEDQHALHVLGASFSHLEKTIGTQAPDETPNSAKWAGSYAVFEADTHWLDTFIRVREALPIQFQSTCRVLHNLTQALCSADGYFTWCVQLDHAALDVDLGRCQWKYISGRLHFHPETGTIRIEWKRMLKVFLRTEAEIAWRMRQNNPQYAYGREEDCVREVRRERFLRGLNLRREDDRSS